MFSSHHYNDGSNKVILLQNHVNMSLFELYSSEHREIFWVILFLSLLLIFLKPLSLLQFYCGFYALCLMCSGLVSFLYFFIL